MNDSAITCSFRPGGARPGTLLIGDRFWKTRRISVGLQGLRGVCRSTLPGLGS
ncbi:hypothetical protein [Streptomyces sp. Tu102]|uniref:hypothetical protein n=1 Tax=Streptomyces TaxID=1883 RepID=UPI001BDBC641|nr:hypothetical protein [Streptomyces sp. Tu102]MBT1098031.1 hypothetical protein [Streptomyces sp. Tu102]